MPAYKAIAPGTFDNVYYAPGSKRDVLVTDEPLNPIPKWLTPTNERSQKATAATKRQQAADTEKKKQELREQENQIAATNNLPSPAQNQAPKEAPDKGSAVVEILG
jgi:hypothetical protein